MPVRTEATPNPNAVKFTVGVQVGGPRSYTPGDEVDHPVAGQLLALPGVASVFMTADFVTVTKQPSADWSDIVPEAERILEHHFG
ncbi:MAG: hypothetical protein KatS3mg011_1516 [Acidimicrobiia bacterium]|nr:MAG: hypothetical protein KatS3mg011_1516 [Acidimicrobiia bacterium]